MHIVFFSTNDVFKAEELLSENDVKCKVVPTPVTDKAYCGVCIETFENIENILHDLEYKMII